MKILHVAQPTTAGVARVVLQAAAYQAGLGHDVAVASPEGELAECVRAAGLHWQEWDARRSPGPATAAEVVRLRRVIRAERPDLLHLHASKAGLAGRLAVGKGMRVVFQPHSWSFEATNGMMSAAVRRWERWAQRRTDATLWCSWGEQTVGLLAGVRAAGVVTMNGVDLTQFRPATAEMRAAARVRLGVPGPAPTAVVVGRLARQKGQDVVVRAWPQVRARCPEARLLLLGDGPDRDALAARAGEGVHLLGDGPSPDTVFHAADLALMPSRWEGMSLAMIEGMASGLSTVATDVSGAREALLTGSLPVAGEVVTPESEPELVDAVVRRFTDPMARRAEGVAARLRAEQEFASESAMQTMVSTYDLITALDLPRQERRRPTPDASAVPPQRRRVQLPRQQGRPSGVRR